MFRLILVVAIATASTVQLIKSLKLKRSLACLTYTADELHTRTRYINISIFFSAFSILILVTGLLLNVYMLYWR